MKELGSVPENSYTPWRLYFPDEGGGGGGSPCVSFSNPDSWGGYRLRGLLDWDVSSGTWKKNEKWIWVKRINDKLKVLGPIVAASSFQWAGAGSAAAPTTILGSFVDSVRSQKYPDIDTAYVELAFFSGSGQDSFMLLVNRRVRSTEGQDVTVWMNRSGHRYVIDQLTGDTTLTGSINSSSPYAAPFTTVLGPGEGKLFKVIPAPQYINGSAFPLTWQGKITIDGDVTVPSGKTLKILPPQGQFSPLANKDTTSAGVDIKKVELIINSGGKLVAVGKSNDPVKFWSAAGTPSDSDWYGIRVKTGGSAQLQYANIRNAYSGISYHNVSASDTLKNVHIARCLVYGVRADTVPNLVIRNCGIDSIRTTVGGTGIFIWSGQNGGPILRSDTVRACYYGMDIWRWASVESCRVEGTDTIGSFISRTGIKSSGQGTSAPTTELNVAATDITGYFADQHFQNAALHGRSSLGLCRLLSLESPRSPYGIRNTGGDYLYMRYSTVRDWRLEGLLIETNSGATVTDLGTVPDSGFNSIHTSMPIWDEETEKIIWWWYVKDMDCSSCSTPEVKAEGNYWAGCPPLTNRFSTNIDWNPCLGSAPPKLIADEGGTEVLPKPTDLFQNYPNPFNPTTLIQFNLEKTERVDLDIFNILGQRVRTLLSGEEFAAGPYSFIWDGKDDRGASVSSGMYIYRLSTPGYLKTKKMMMVK